MKRVRIKNLVWVIDGDRSACRSYRALLSRRFKLESFESLGEVRGALKAGGLPDLVLSDLVLPDGRFLEFRSRPQCGPDFLEVPFIIISSEEAVAVVRASFDLGAEGYFTKPVQKNLFLGKVASVMDERSGRNRTLRSEIALDLTTLRLKRGGSHVLLTAKEIQIFSILYRDSGKSVSREHIEEEVWKNVRVSAKTLDVHIFNLRKKLSRLKIKIRYNAPAGFTLISG